MLEEYKKELESINAQLERVKADLYRLDGISMYLKGKIAEIEHPKDETVEKTAEE